MLRHSHIISTKKSSFVCVIISALTDCSTLCFISPYYPPPPPPPFHSSQHAHTFKGQSGPRKRVKWLIVAYCPTVRDLLLRVGGKEAKSNINFHWLFVRFINVHRCLKTACLKGYSRALFCTLSRLGINGGKNGPCLSRGSPLLHATLYLYMCLQSLKVL